MAAYINQKKKIEDTEKFIDRFRAKASKAVQVQSRIKQLDKIDRLEVEDEDNAAIHFRFPDAPRSGKVVITAENIHKTYDKKEILRGLDFLVERGDKIAFVGRNGEGKTTLSKIITGKIEFTGKIEIGHNVKVGYYAQNQAELLDMNSTVLETLENVARNTTTAQLRNILGSFLFSGETVDKKVRVLSGGEKGRLALAKLLLEPVNLLVLDEPTNHLDMRSKDILKEALRKYDGTMILVSHDREFLDGLCNKVYEFNKGLVREFPGGIFEFLQSRKLESLTELETVQKQIVKPAALPMPAKVNAEQDKIAKQHQTKVRNCEERIAVLEAKVKLAEEKLSDENIYNDQQKANLLLKEYEQLKGSLETEVQLWESLLSI
jgi:ATP-binding cassette subfamily F protein 3